MLNGDQFAGNKFFISSGNSDLTSSDILIDDVTLLNVNTGLLSQD